MVKNNTTGGVLMRKNKYYFICLPVLLLLTVLCAQAQDTPSVLPPADAITQPVKPLRAYTFTPDTISVFIPLPECFIESGENRIIDKAGVLAPLLERLRLLRAGALTDTIRIVHIGDSHVRGHIFPDTVGARLREVFGSVAYTGMGVNGATCLTFTHPARIDAITEAHPELLILSFGTNESHNRRYNSTAHYNQIDELVRLLRNNLPDVPIILTTPPGSYESFRQRGRRRTYSINPRTSIAVDTIRRYADSHKLAVWDMYTLAGGKAYACKNWKAAGLMRPDHIHYLPEAYALQGELLFEAIINAYNDYVTL